MKPGNDLAVVGLCLFAHLPSSFGRLASFTQQPREPPQDGSRLLQFGLKVGIGVLPILDEEGVSLSRSIDFAERREIGPQRPRMPDGVHDRGWSAAHS
jgi:hypothetical protein